MTSEPIIDDYEGPTVWDQLIPVCILAAILLVFLLACLKECHFKYSRSKVRNLVIVCKNNLGSGFFPSVPS